MGRLTRAINFTGEHFQKEKLEFFGHFFQIEKYFAKLDKVLNRCLDFSLIDCFATVFCTFNHILSNKNKKHKKHMFLQKFLI